MTNYAVGTSNWSLTLNPGSYGVSVQSQDGAGNFSAASNEMVTVTAVLTNGDGTVTFTQGATTNLNAVGYPFQIGSNYNLQANAGTNQVFVSWTIGGRTILSPGISFTMASNALLTATFISNSLPNSVAFTYPEADAVLTTNTFAISGSITNVTALPVTITCQLYSSNTFLPVGPPLTTTGETDWSIIETNIPNDAYQVEITAVDAASNTTVISEDFAVAVISSEPETITINDGSTANFSVTDSNAMSYQWQFNGTNIMGATNSTLSIENVNNTNAGSYTVVIDNSITSSPPAVLTLVPGTIVTLDLSGLLMSAPQTNLQVELFDHDKPATVENFLHYIQSGAYTNMFFDRLAANFVLQGGDYGATDRTNTNAPLTGWDISRYVKGTNFSPFPAQLHNEAGVGPQINNDFGTIAMALGSSTNSASSAFFFNLGNNSSTLDGTSDGGPFTVFGRVINGTNLLAYFNTLSNGNGEVPPATFLDDGTPTTIPGLNLLPVDYASNNAPANTNLLFCDFELPTNAPVDMNAPTVSISSPASGEITTNGAPVIEGTAADDVGLADVIVVLTPQGAEDGTYPNRRFAITNYAVGTSNWSLAVSNANEPSGKGLVPPGVYNLNVRSQDGYGNLSEAIDQTLTITTVETNGDGTVTLTNGNFTDINAVGYPFQLGSYYFLQATPAPNWAFVSWSYYSTTALSLLENLPMQDGVIWTATFISNGIPNSIAFTYPASNGVVDVGPLNITGTISGAVAPPVTVVCQVYSATGYTNVGPALTNVGTANWSVTASNLFVGQYVVQAIATDSASNTTVISEDFTVSTNAALQLNIVGPGTVSGATNGEPILVGAPLTLTAMPNPGQLFYIWSNANGVSINPTQSITMSPGLDLTAIFVSNTLSNSIAFTAPAENVVLSNGAVQVSGTIANVPAPPVNINCQIFSQSTLTNVTAAATTSGTTNWSLLMSGLSPGSYIAVVEAVDQAGNSTVVKQSFNAFADGTLPAIAILSPASNAVVADNAPLIVSGTASDTNGISVVSDYLVPQSAFDGVFPNRGASVGGIANGTTNWTANFGVIPAGVYTDYVQAIDNAGNNAQITQMVTNTAVLIKGDGTVALAQGTNAKPDPIGYPLQNGTAYTLTATPAAGQTFIGWSQSTYNTTNPTVTFTNATGNLSDRDVCAGQRGKRNLVHLSAKEREVDHERFSAKRQNVRRL